MPQWVCSWCAAAVVARKPGMPSRAKTQCHGWHLASSAKPAKSACIRCGYKPTTTAYTELPDRPVHVHDIRLDNVHKLILPGTEHCSILVNSPPKRSLQEDFGGSLCFASSVACAEAAAQLSGERPDPAVACHNNHKASQENDAEVETSMKFETSHQDLLGNALQSVHGC